MFNLSKLISKKQTPIQSYIIIKFLQALNQTYKEMFDQSSRQKKQRSWKIINLNLNDVHQQPEYNRSVIADQSKKYCPRKNSSHQKIFSKSKQRLNLSKNQNSLQQSFKFKVENKQIHRQNYEYLNQKSLQNNHSQHVDTEFRQNCKYQQTPPYQQKTSSKNSSEVNQAYQTAQNKKPYRNMNRANDFHFQQILNSSKINSKSTQKYPQLQKQIKENFSVVYDLKEQFETFKQIVLSQLEQEKEFLRQCFQKLTEQFVFIKEKIRQQVLAELQIQQMHVSPCQRQNQNKSTEIKFQKNFIKKDHLQQDLTVVDSLNMIHIDTFGKIQQPNGQEMDFGLKIEEGFKIEEAPINLSQIQQRKISPQVDDHSFEISQNGRQKSLHPLQNHHNQDRNAITFQSIVSIQKMKKQFGTQTQISDAAVNRQVPIRELRTYKSSGNFTHTSAVNHNIYQPLTSQNNMNSQYMSQIQSITSKTRIDEADQMQRFSQILKKQYEQKTKNSVYVSRLNQEKINQRMNHVSKFQGAMQKLKSEIMQFKNLSDTKDIKKIKFLQPKASQKYLKQIKPNQISIDAMSVNDQAQKGY